MDITACSTSVAREVSERMVASAISSVNVKLSDKNWVMNKREIRGEPKNASWDVPMKGELTVNEAESVARSFRSAMWNASCIYSPNNNDGNWTIRLQEKE